MDHVSGDTAPRSLTVDMTARYSDEIEQLIRSDIAAPHHQTDRRLA
jgi:hypothetical protein